MAQQPTPQVQRSGGSPRQPPSANAPSFGRLGWFALGIAAAFALQQVDLFGGEE